MSNASLLVRYLLFEGKISIAAKYIFAITRSHLDQDVRGLVQVKIIHGSWKKEDPHRLSLEVCGEMAFMGTICSKPIWEERLIGLPQEAAKKHPNIQLITAYMPEPFGTHHSKMMILIRHDNSAQYVHQSYHAHT
jgi:tyrosyl-DNA phosphodiesterase-1